MGVASGRLIPEAGYASIQAAVIAANTNQASQQALQLSAHASGGQTLDACGGVYITDYSADLGPGGLQVDVLGIAYPLYGELFPEQVATYERQFQRDG